MSIDLKSLIEFGKSLNVLFVEDNKEVRDQLIKLLQNFFTNIDIAEDGLEGHEKYLEFHKNNNRNYDIIITDVSMPRMDGIEFVKKINEINPFQIIVVISAHTEPNTLKKLNENGIYKFLRKPVDYSEFLDNFSSIISKIKRENIEQNISLEPSFKNRTIIENDLVNHFSTIKNSNLLMNEFMVILIDIDDFNQVNDNKDKETANRILLEFLNIIDSSIDEHITFGRWGGSEFLIALESNNSSYALQLSNKLHKIINESLFSNKHKITASFGLSKYKVDDSISTFVQRADFSLYKAKKNGKNRVEFI